MIVLDLTTNSLKMIPYVFHNYIFHTSLCEFRDSISYLTDYVHLQASKFGQMFLFVLECSIRSLASCSARLLPRSEWSMRSAQSWSACQNWFGDCCGTKRCFKPMSDIFHHWRNLDHSWQETNEENFMCRSWCGHLSHFFFIFLSPSL